MQNDEIRGTLRHNAPLGTAGWFKCGGNVATLFKPADTDDLAAYIARHPGEIIYPFGVLSNTIIRDGGLAGTAVRFGRAFAGIEARGASEIYAGAGALDANVAEMAARQGIAGLEFFGSIPGSVGGALRMNAGCYGTETRDVLVEAYVLDEAGQARTLTPDQMGMTYRHVDIPEAWIFTGALFRGEKGESETIRARLAEFKGRREATQPLREKTGGSTFANPGAEELEAAGLPSDTKVWQLIDQTGGRDLQIGGAEMSDKHCNFMINTGTATAADLEELGEAIRARVYETFGISLRWEIRRMGQRA